MKICVAGQGAFGIKHLEALRNIPGVEVVTLAGGSPDSTRRSRRRSTTSPTGRSTSPSLAQPGVEAVILATPTQMHAEQAVQCMRAGKHVMIEIPMADSLADSERSPGAEGNRPRRHGRPHAPLQSQPPVGPQEDQGRRAEGQQMEVQTYFFRRTNMNAPASPAAGRTTCSGTTPATRWTCSRTRRARRLELHALQGPHHPELNIAMDMSIGMKVPSGAICTLSLSFNNNGPLGTFFRYICDNGTYIARYDDLVDGKNNRSTCRRWTSR